MTPRFPARRPLGLARLILRSQRIQVWLEDESLKDSANLPLIWDQWLPGFPRHTQSLRASCRKAGRPLNARGQRSIPASFAEIVEDLEAPLQQFAAIAGDLGSAEKEEKSSRSRGAIANTRDACAPQMEEPASRPCPICRSRRGPRNPG